MREILFRGQTRRYGEKVWMNGNKVPSNWVYGGICQGKGSLSIIYGSMYDKLEAPAEKHVIYTDTVGQYTGLRDKNGKKIFEGDILPIYEQGEEYNYKVIYNGDCFMLAMLDSEQGSYPLSIKNTISEVIGNIHDSPELLKGEKDDA